MLRRPCVAGQFYPGDEDALERAVDGLMPRAASREKARALISPHAGYIYSGEVAGAVWSSVEVPRDVILIGPNHTGLGRMVSVMAEGTWQTPAGDVEVNPDLADLLLENPLYSNDDDAHLHEHSLEVQLPFLLAARGDARIVPVTVMHATADETEELGKTLARAVRDYPREVLIAVSSDMNHYEPDDVTRKKDQEAIDRVLELDARGLLEVTARKNITMCGVLPTAIAIYACRELGSEKARLVKYATSADASGDFSQVVGYAGIVIE